MVLRHSTTVDTTFSGQDAGFDESNGFADAAAGIGSTIQSGTNPAVLNPVGSATSSDYTVGGGMRKDSAESLDGTGSDAFNQMAFSIEKVTVTAKSRALKARVQHSSCSGPQGNPRSER